MIVTVNTTLRMYYCTKLILISKRAQVNMFIMRLELHSIAYNNKHQCTNMFIMGLELHNGLVMNGIIQPYGNAN